MIGLDDFLSDKVRQLHSDASRALAQAGRINGVVLYSCGGSEKAVPLDIGLLLNTEAAKRHWDLVVMAAELMNMPPAMLISMARMPQDGCSRPIPGPRWVGMVMARLRAIRPNYFVVVTEVYALTPAKAGISMEEAKRIAAAHKIHEHQKAEGQLMVAGFNPVRSFCLVTPYVVRGGKVVLGRAMTLDSIATPGHQMQGTFGSVYLPSPS